jgi:hypothetical protein
MDGATVANGVAVTGGVVVAGAGAGVVDVGVGVVVAGVVEAGVVDVGMGVVAAGAGVVDVGRAGVGTGGRRLATGRVRRVLEAAVRLFTRRPALAMTARGVVSVALTAVWQRRADVAWMRGHRALCGRAAATPANVADAIDRRRPSVTPMPITSRFIRAIDRRGGHDGDFIDDFWTNVRRGAQIVEARDAGQCEWAARR